MGLVRLRRCCVSFLLIILQLIRNRRSNSVRILQQSTDIEHCTDIGAIRKVFALAGYSVAVIARNPDHVKKTVDEVTAAGGEVCSSKVCEWPNSLIAYAIAGSSIRRARI